MMQTVREHYPNLKLYSLSEKAITINFGDSISADLLTQITAVNQLVQEQPFPGMITTVPAYSTLTVYFDPLQVYKSTLDGWRCLDKVGNYILSLSLTDRQSTLNTIAPIIIPTCYGGSYGPDLEAVAAMHHLSSEAVISIHSAAAYIVYMIGFVPGFAYLGGMDKILASPRKATPRAAVPAGSVGIAGEQTGVYPLDTPGGWQIIGRTPLSMFDTDRTQPSLLKAGDRVQFKPITTSQFKQYQLT
ncbi:5-oxoprolinase subunit PxpB [Mucilaginibacter sp. CSA2-8R]|uniref:5-oxoprolinase subunit PxpB n=1 Tax=Mucilaginibacter sp. CSA2-8R TaxID=3141542 RepID=UPI00315D7EE3